MDSPLRRNGVFVDLAAAGQQIVCFGPLLPGNEIVREVVLSLGGRAGGAVVQGDNVAIEAAVCNRMISTSAEFDTQRSLFATSLSAPPQLPIIGNCQHRVPLSFRPTQAERYIAFRLTDASTFGSRGGIWLTVDDSINEIPVVRDPIPDSVVTEPDRG